MDQTYDMPPTAKPDASQERTHFDHPPAVRASRRNRPPPPPANFDQSSPATSNIYSYPIPSRPFSKGSHRQPPSQPGPPPPRLRQKQAMASPTLGPTAQPSPATGAATSDPQTGYVRPIPQDLSMKHPLHRYDGTREVMDDDQQSFDSGFHAAYSRPVTGSSMNTIPDFPERHLSASTRKSRSSRGPPTSRKRLQSYYSNTTGVAPIPEEQSRLHESYASSAVIPTSWGPLYQPTSRQNNPVPYYQDPTYDEKMSDADDVDGGLVRSASIGKKGKPSLVDAKSSLSTSKEDHTPLRSIPSPVPTIPYPDRPPVPSPAADPGALRTIVAPLARPASASSLSSEALDKMLEATEIPIALGDAPGDAPEKPHRMSMLRPSRLDMDAVRKAEARGSLTSLPDLIRRATRLAGMLDAGKRPGSRIDDLSMSLHDKSQSNLALHLNRRKSGLSDMLASFPPPADGDRGSRGTWFRVTSWPLGPQKNASDATGDQNPERPLRRKCCGMPLWLFSIMMLLLLCGIAAAIVLPLEFFVFKNLGSHQSSDSEMDHCKASLQCEHGGMNVLSQGSCSCLCTNGFTGPDCSIAGSSACSTTTLPLNDGSGATTQATLGKSIPRLVTSVSVDFAVPLRGTDILAKLNAANVSCIVQNSLVTFDGTSMKRRARVQDLDGQPDASQRNGRLDTMKAVPTTVMTMAKRGEMPTASAATSEPSALATATFTSNTVASTSAASHEQGAAAVLDFARVAILYVLQERSFAAAGDAQTNLQGFFDGVDLNQLGDKAASAVQAGDGVIVNLVDFTIDLGNGPVGHGSHGSL